MFNYIPNNLSVKSKWVAQAIVKEVLSVKGGDTHAVKATEQLWFRRTTLATAARSYRVIARELVPEMENVYDEINARPVLDDGQQ